MKKSLNILICCFVVILFAGSCSEEGIDDNSGIGTLEGMVVKAEGNTPLENVKITTSPASTTVFTDEEGKFIIEEIPAGTYSVQASLDEYQTAFKPARITHGLVSNVVFELEVSTINNLPPSIPILITPEDNSVVDSTSVEFVWSAQDPENDDLTYTLELRNDLDNEIEVFESIEDTTYVHTSLRIGAKYFWQVTVTDGVNEPVKSQISTFRVTNPQIGNRVLYVRNIGGNNVIISINEEGEEYMLTSENKNSYRPVRNVAADRIAYLQSTGAQVDIYTMKRDGTDKTKVTSSIRPNGFNLNEITIDWPQNSNRIYFANLNKLYRIGSDGQGLHLVYQTTDGSLISEMSVNENSNIIALKTNNLDGYDVKIFTIDFNGNTLATLLNEKPGAVSGLDMSVSTRKIIYSYDVTGSQSSDYRRWDSRIFLYDMNTLETIELSERKDAGTNDLEPSFSPNEAYIIFTNTSNDGISKKYIYTQEIGEMERDLVQSDAFMPDWK